MRNVDEAIMTGTEIKQGGRVPSPPQGFTLRQFARSIGWLLLIPAFVYLITFPLVMIPRLGFGQLGISKFGPVLDYGYDVRNANADVVIFGDSSAFIGIDPRVINAELGIKSVVIPNTVGSLPVLGIMPLERYLAHNRPPRLLVLYFSSWNLDYNDPKRQHLLFEGEEILLRHGSWLEITKFAQQRPQEMLTFPFKVYSTLGWSNLSYAIEHRAHVQDTASFMGHMDYAFSYPPMSDTCKLLASNISNAGDASVRALMNKYQNAGTPVRVYLAPIPGCSNADIFLTNSYPDLGAAKPRVLPPSWFAGDDSDAHIRPAAVAANSRLFARSLDPWLKDVGISSVSRDAQTSP